MFIKNCKMIYPDRVEEGSVLIKEGKIVEINPKSVQDKCTIDAQGLYLSPGFIDIHIHGAGGRDVMEGSYEAINDISKVIAKKGITSFVPTTMTLEAKKIHQAVSSINEAMIRGTEGANVLGVHLEGPFISPLMIGAQNPLYIQSPSVESFKSLVGDFIKSIITVTIAPEIEGAVELIKFLRQNNISVSIGHSKATYLQAIEGIKCGVSHATHLYNAMTGLHHRDAGVVGAIFDSSITTEVICDGIHIGYPALRIALKQKSADKLMLISDAMMACCMPDGRYTLGGQKVIAENHSARLENGALAGSVLTIDRAIKNLYENTDYELFEVVKMATINPAKHCRIGNRKGIIKEGYDADLVLFDEKIQIQSVVINGAISDKF